MIYYIGDVPDFLRNRGLLQKFIRNLKDDWSHWKIKGKVQEYFNDYERAPNAISSAFAWDETPEGHKFWDRINTQRRKSCHA